MGAAGMTSSSLRWQGRAKTGVELDLENVPRREEGMTPYEIMLSESQERMLLVCRKGVEDGVKEIFSRWGLAAERVGVVTKDGMVRLKENGTTVAELPAQPLSEQAPVYHRPASPPEDLAERQSLDISSIAEPRDYGKTLLKLLSSPNLCSREWIFRQYDHSVRTDTIELPAPTHPS